MTVKNRRKHSKHHTGIIFLTVFCSVTALGLLTLLTIHLLGANRAGSGKIYAEAEYGQMEIQGAQPDSQSRQEAGAGSGVQEGSVLARIEGETGNFQPEEPVEEDASKYGKILADEQQMQQMNAIEITQADESGVTISFGGDILFDDSYSPMVHLKQRGGDITSVISPELLQEMDAADVMMVNNEFTYTSRGVPTEGKTYAFRAKPSHVSYLKDLSVDVVSLANNHAYDYGEISLTDTLDTLTEAGIPYVGAGRNLEEASRPLYLMTEDIKIALIGATQIERLDNPDTKGATETAPGVFRCWNPERLYETVRQTKQESDFVIVYIHWGTEGTTALDWAQTEQAKGLAAAGADLIVGNHPHCLQEIGYVDGVPVIYSLGNYWFNSKPLDTCLVKATITPEGLRSLQFLPARQENCYTELLTGTEAGRVIQYMNGLSKTAQIGMDGYVAPR